MPWGTCGGSVGGAGPNARGPRARGQDTGQEQDPGQIAGLLNPLATNKKMGKQTGTLIVDAESGSTLYDNNGSTR